MDAYENLPDYTLSLITEGNVIPCSIGVDHLSRCGMDEEDIDRLIRQLTAAK